MTVMKIDELFSFCDFEGSGREEGHRAAWLFIYICPF